MHCPQGDDDEEEEDVDIAPEDDGDQPAPSEQQQPEDGPPGENLSCYCSLALPPKSAKIKV